MNTRLHSLKVIMPLALVVMTCAGLAGCGGGGGGGSRPASGGGGDQMTIMPPTDNRTPVVVQTFTDITITLDDGGPERWLSGDLGAHFSDPDDDHLSYSVGSSNESVAGVVISEPGPIVIVQAQGGGVATITITARDPGGLTATQSFGVTVTGRPDHSNTPAGATAIALRESFQGQIDSPSDVDYFRLRVNAPGTLTIETTGTADPDIAVYDAEGIEVPGVTGSWIGTITQAILDKGDLLVKFSGGNEGEEYTARATLDQQSQGPDLEVGTPTVSDSGPQPGASFTLSATVSNTGNGESPATTLRYYRSTDATITTSDTELDTDAAVGIAALGSFSESVELTAPSTVGTYYYGACVDAVAGESNTTNNCSAAVQVTVTHPDKPDLVVYAVTTATNPFGGTRPGGLIQMSAGVRNQGGVASPATTLRFYQSTDATITTSDTEVGTDTVAELAASGTRSHGSDVTAPPTAGTYYYGACVDSVTDESDATNNCSASVKVDVEAPKYPDLEVGTPTVSDSGPETGASFTLSATVSNTGDGESPATTLRYYRSTDATITTSDTAAGTDAVVALSASGTSAESISVTAPATAGAYYYGACVDTVTGESNTTNNCSASVKVDVEAPKYPDLEVGTPTVSDSGPETGASFTLSATVSNTGDGESPATTLRYYRSTDATITTSDTAAGTDAVVALSASGTSAESISVTAPATAGAYYYGACVDTVTGESDTTNNCGPAVLIAVVSAERPDLVVEPPTVDSRFPSAGTTFTLSATVRNLSRVGTSEATTLRYYRSTDATIRTSDTSVGTDEVPALDPLFSSEESVELTAPLTAGTYYYGACVDAVAGESNTNNNCSTSVQVTVPVPEPQPDLVVGSASVDDSNLNTGDSFTLSATVSNAGDEQSAATTLRYYRSTDLTISSSDTQVGTDAVGALSASGTSAESISLTAPSTAGTYYYGACVDAVTDESDTTNNCSSSVTIAVEEESTGQPDLRIVGVSVGTPLFSPVVPGTLLQFSVNVRNYGDANSDATTLRYYRSTDATISVSDTEVGTDEVSALVPSRQVVEGIDLTAPSTGTYYYGACVDAVTDESDTTNNCSEALQIDVN